MQEEEETDKNTPEKSNNDQSNLEVAKTNNKIHLPLLVLELNKKSEWEVLTNEDHTEVVICFKNPLKMYNDNHVLLNTGLLSEADQGTIQNLYDTEIKSVNLKQEEQEMRKRRKTDVQMSNTKENMYRDKDFNSPL